MTRSHISRILALVWALAGTTPAAAQGARSCNDHESLSMCERFEPRAYELLGEEFYRGVCVLTGGRWAHEGCPDDDAVGYCDDGGGGRRTYYSNGGDPYDADRARRSCQQFQGTFLPPRASPPVPEVPEFRTCDAFEEASACSRHSAEALREHGELTLWAHCEIYGGTWGAAPCPSVGVVGTCETGTGNRSSYYSTGGEPRNPASAAHQCRIDGGEFASPGGEPPFRTCDRRAVGSLCVRSLRRLLDAPAENTLAEACGADGGDWGFDPCPESSMLSRCDEGEGRMTVYYSSGGAPFDRSTAGEACGQAGGRFVPLIPPPDPAPRSCEALESRGRCTDYEPRALVTGFGEPFAADMCDLNQGDWSAAPCPDEGRVVTCGDGVGTWIHLYDAGGNVVDPTQAKELCEEFGTYVPAR